MDATKQFAIISKCKIKISTEQDKIRSLYAELGKLYYKDFVTDEEPDEAEYLPLCNRISAHYRKIAQLRERMNKAKTDYQGVKQEDQEIKQQATEEENRLITLATTQPELPAVSGKVLGTSTPKASISRLLPHSSCSPCRLQRMPWPGISSASETRAASGSLPHASRMEREIGWPE